MKAALADVLLISVVLVDAVLDGEDDADVELVVELLDPERMDCNMFGAGIPFTTSLSGVEHAGLPSASAPQHRHSLSV